MPTEKATLDKSRVKEEYQLIQRFWGVFQSKLEDIRARTGIENFKLEDSERELLLSINNLGLKEGALAGIASLVLLRRIRANFLRRLVQQRDSLAKTHHHTYGQPSSSSTPHVQNSPFAQGVNAAPPPSSSHSSKLDQYILQRSRPFSFANLFGWALDGAVSFSIAASTSLIFMDRQVMLNTFARIPLVPGTSAISDEFCPTLLDELERLSRHDQAAKALLDRPQTPDLAAWTEFAKNCQLRQSYERQARRQLGLSASERVAIPQPGLPGAFQEAGFSWSSSPGEDESAASLGGTAGYDADTDSEGEFFNQATWTDDFTTTEDDDSAGSSSRK